MSGCFLTAGFGFSGSEIWLCHLDTFHGTTPSMVWILMIVLPKVRIQCPRVGLGISSLFLYKRVPAEKGNSVFVNEAFEPIPTSGYFYQQSK